MGESRRVLNGTGIYDGIGEGTAFVIRQFKHDFKADSSLTVEQEERRLNDAFKKFTGELNEMIGKAREHSAGGEADILEAQLILSQDSSLFRTTIEYIKKGRTAEYAIDTVCSELNRRFIGSGERSLIDRIEDIRDIEHRMMVILSEKKVPDFKNLPENAVLICDEVGSDFIPMLYSKNLLGVVTQRGSKSGHAAIVVRGISIPSVFSVTGILRFVRDGQKVIVDGKNGKVYINPAPEDVEKCRSLKAEIEEKKRRFEKYKSLPGLTGDGVPFAVLANIGSDEGLSRAYENGCEGVGLFRTEYLFQKQGVEPSEEEQFESYRKAAVLMNDRDTVIRTIDIGGDKLMPYLLRPSAKRGTSERNPFLGLRGIRRSLAFKDTFLRQIRAILRAAVYGRVSINLPMITTLGELREAKNIIREAEDQLADEGKDFRKNVPVGIMMETPSAALIADELAKEVDFFSVGTNDLTQYIMCAERDNPSVEYLFSALEPAVIRVIYNVIMSARKAGIRVGICGEASHDVRFLAMLVAWGADGVSVNPSYVTEVRALVAGLENKGGEEIFKPVLSMGSREEIEDYLNRRFA